jgi:hypothetical protein
MAEAPGCPDASVSINPSYSIQLRYALPPPPLSPAQSAAPDLRGRLAPPTLLIQRRLQPATGEILVRMQIRAYPLDVVVGTRTTVDIHAEI